LQFIELRFKCFLHRFLVLNAGWCDLHSHSSCFVGQRRDPQIEDYIYIYYYQRQAHWVDKLRTYGK
jgi:hypothetical protein